MKTHIQGPTETAKQAALEVLLHNSHGPYHGLFRTAGWGYPEPYTRDLMIASLGILATGNDRLVASLRRVLETLARNQTPRGHIPSLAHDPEDRGASDTTPLFLLGLGLYRKATGEEFFLDDAACRALTWMEYQSPGDRVMVAQQPTSDWRDEQWVMGFGLYVNAIVFACLRLFGRHEQAALLKDLMGRFVISEDAVPRHIREGLVVPHKPYYAMWSYKLFQSTRFDLLGNSMAVLFGLASPSRSRAIVSWVERECQALQASDQLRLDLPPCLFPYIQPGAPDWRPRYERYNMPGEYHNGGVWPFICGFYIAAAVAAGMHAAAAKKLEALTKLVRPARERPVDFGFNEWFRAQDGSVQGQDWQTWSAAMYLYAAACVEKGAPVFFERLPASSGQDDETEEPWRTEHADCRKDAIEPVGDNGSE